MHIGISSLRRYEGKGISFYSMICGYARTVNKSGSIANAWTIFLLCIIYLNEIFGKYVNGGQCRCMITRCEFTLNFCVIHSLIQVGASEL